MLIITADDYGENVQATDRILDCFRSGSLTSASAMVFMHDSARAATLARETKLEVGLHLNLSEAFTEPAVDDNVRRQHARIVRYLNSHRFAHAVFNPFLSDAFRLVVQSQWAEFERLYGRPPDFVNGHHHMHLSANVLGQRLLPARSRLRGPFTFKTGEKGGVNRWYRSRLARRLRKLYITPDCLYSIEPFTAFERLRRITKESADRDVELEVHPEDPTQHQLLLSRDFHQLLDGIKLQGFQHLEPESVH